MTELREFAGEMGREQRAGRQPMSVLFLLCDDCGQTPRDSSVPKTYKPCQAQAHRRVVGQLSAGGRPRPAAAAGTRRCRAGRARRRCRRSGCRRMHVLGQMCARTSLSTWRPVRRRAATPRPWYSVHQQTMASWPTSGTTSARSDVRGAGAAARPRRRRRASGVGSQFLALVQLPGDAPPVRPVDDVACRPSREAARHHTNHGTAGK